MVYKADQINLKLILFITMETFCHIEIGNLVLKSQGNDLVHPRFFGITYIF